MATSLPSIKTILYNGVGPCDIQVTDANDTNVDATTISIDVLDLGSNVLLHDNITDVGTNIVKPSATVGYYYYNFGAANNTVPLTNQIQDYLLQWNITISSSPLPITIIQNVKIITPLVMQNLPYFKLIIDKARKMVDPSNQVYLGYTDEQLIMYMEDGMNIINGYQPETVAGFNLNNFPWTTFRHIANESALMAGVLSQQLFAIDTDMPNYSDQGVTFVIAHQPQLAQLFNTISQRLDKMIPMMKQQFVTTGSIHMEMGPNFKLATLLNAAPMGALFKNLYFKG